jgi:hypothetical protein
MGFFTDMARPAGAGDGGYKTFVLHVNGVGDYVVQRLGPDGRVTDFTAGVDFEDMLNDVMGEVTPYYRRAWLLDPDDPGLAECMTDTYQTWAAFVAAANAEKRSGKAATAVALLGTFAIIGRERFVRYDSGARRYVLTEEGAAWDAKHYPPTAPESG